MQLDLTRKLPRTASFFAQASAGASGILLCAVTAALQSPAPASHGTLHPTRYATTNAAATAVTA